MTIPATNRLSHMTALCAWVVPLLGGLAAFALVVRAIDTRSATGIPYVTALLVSLSGPAFILFAFWNLPKTCRLLFWFNVVIGMLVSFVTYGIMLIGRMTAAGGGH